MTNELSSNDETNARTPQEIALGIRISAFGIHSGIRVSEFEFQAHAFAADLMMPHSLGSALFVQCHPTG
jgi:hypothetical protein